VTSYPGRSFIVLKIMMPPLSVPPGRNIPYKGGTRT
jgi:hypothetical protein